jgi:hypothetical protein
VTCRTLTITRDRPVIILLTTCGCSFHRCDAWLLPPPLPPTGLAHLPLAACGRGGATAASPHLLTTARRNFYSQRPPWSSSSPPPKTLTSTFRRRLHHPWHPPPRLLSATICPVQSGFAQRRISENLEHVSVTFEMPIMCGIISTTLGHTKQAEKAPEHFTRSQQW